METFSALLAFYDRDSPVTGEFPSHGPVTWSFHVSFDLRAREQSAEVAIKTPVIWDAIALIITSL